MMMTPSSLVCAVTLLAAVPVVSAAPFVPPMGMTLVEPSHKRRRVDFAQDKVKMLAAFEELWASSQSFSLRSGQSSAPPPPLVTPPVDVPAPVLSAVPVAILVTSAAASSARSGSLSPSATSSS